MLIPTELPEANSRILNLQRATTDYVAEYNVCKCRPCHNGGTLTLLDGRCLCMCPDLFEGLGCQNFKGDKARVPRKRRHGPCPDRCLCFCYLCPNCMIFAAPRPSVIQEGNWSCWSSWSSCQGQKRSRTRRCNTVGVLGATCRGDTRSEEYCWTASLFKFLFFQNVSDIWKIHKPHLQGSPVKNGATCWSLMVITT